jgi:hypothetical protein
MDMHLPFAKTHTVCWKLTTRKRNLLMSLSPLKFATQVAALTNQSQLMANTDTNTSVRQKKQLAHLGTQHQLMHQNMHQLIDGLNAVTFNQSNKGREVSCFAPGCFAPQGYRGGYGRRSCGHFGRGFLRCRQGRCPSMFGFAPMGGFPPNAGASPGFNQGLPLQGSIQAYRPPQGGPLHPSAPGGQHAPPIAVIQAPPYSIMVKRYANWNAYYSWGVDVPDGHTSMTCPYHLCKPGHDVNFSRQNAQQYMDMGHPCCTHNRHKIALPIM